MEEGKVNKRRLLAVGVAAIGGLALTACYPRGLDATFGTAGVKSSPMSATGNDRFLAVAPGPAGTYYAAGFVASGTDQAYALARFGADGAFDTSFGGGDGIV